MKQTAIRISGNHIKELSENIPSNIFALNELIKNSYDAFATSCRIVIDSSTNKITITDNGLGMGENNIEELFHISKSTKRFGEVKKYRKLTRRVQGSKGLGFLSAFRFGNKVSWETTNNGIQYAFCADKDELIRLDDLSTHLVSITSKSSTEVGTRLSILSDTQTVNSLIAYFTEPENSLKLVGAFKDETFEIKLSLPESSETSNAIPSLKDVNPDDQLFYITYDSIQKEICFFRNGYLEKRMAHKPACNEYELSLELMIFNLESYGRKRISQYFINPRNSSITPLTFINDNLFNNYELFDPNLMRSRKSSSALPQIVGYVDIYSNSKDFEFNSDRTNFVENATTRKLREELRTINELIQITGAELKSRAKKSTDKITGPAFPKRGLKSNNRPLRRAAIQLKKTFEELTVPSAQIELLDYIDHVNDSEGNTVPVSQIQVEIETQIKKQTIIPSVRSPRRMLVTYKFDDSNTGAVFTDLDLRFIEKSASIAGNNASKSLFYILGSDADYKVEITNVSLLMNEIALAHNNYSKYKHMIACSLRTIFEQSSQAVYGKRRIVLTHKWMTENEPASRQSSYIIQVVHFLQNNRKILTEVASLLGLSYQNLSNWLDKREFRNQFEKANVGAHSGGLLLTQSQIADIAKFAGYYAVLCDALVFKIGDNHFLTPEIKDI